MKKVICLLAVITLIAFMAVPVFAEAAVAEDTAEQAAQEAVDSTKNAKAVAAAIAVGIAAAVGAVSMAIAIGKSNESIARQPEAEGAIKSNTMLGLVFIETAIIYALIVAILIIFVL